MKVLMINSVCGVGSTGKICTDIADMLIERGHECRIAYGRNNVPSRYKNIVYRIGSDFGVNINGVKTRLFDNEGGNAKGATKKLIRFIKEYDPDVIHLHNLHGYYLNVGLLFDYLKTCDKKVVWTLHDCWAFTGHCPYFTIARCDKWETGCYKCPNRKEYPKSFFDNSKKMWKLKKEWFTGVKDMTIITPSHWLAELVKQSFLKDYPVQVINNGIDLSVFKPSESDFRKKFGIEDKKIVLGVANVWEHRKGLDVFVELAKRLDNRKYQIVLIGTDDKVDKLLPNGIISIHRTQNQTELAEIYSTADVFVNPTREENYPTVNMEAIACGTPVITFRTGGSPEILIEKTGMVVDSDDIDAMQKDIEDICKKNLFSEEELLIRAKTFDKKANFGEYIDLYKQITDNNNDCERDKKCN